jgi:hypothetical protein
MNKQIQSNATLNPSKPCLRCRECDTPITAKAAKHTPLGYMCSQCVNSGNSLIIDVATRMHSTRDMREGLIWFSVGFVVTTFSMALMSDSFLLAWGPMAYGAFRFVRGLINRR